VNCGEAFVGLAFRPLKPGEVESAGWCEPCLDATDAERSAKENAERRHADDAALALDLEPPRRTQED
jgi:hypothetical protein